LFRAEPPAAGRRHPFDEEFGVDTSGFVSWRDLQAGGSNDPYNSGYLGIAPSIGRKICGMIEQPSEFVFIDIGSGKGRMLIIASEFAFKRVIGVEIGRELAEAGAHNAEVIAAKFPGRPKIESLYADGATFEFPHEPLVVFLNQPFEASVMRRFLQNLEASISAAPRPVVFIYDYPTLADMVDKSPLFDRIGEGFIPIDPAEVPYSFGGRSTGDRFIAWRTKGSGADIKIASS